MGGDAMMAPVGGGSLRFSRAPARPRCSTPSPQSSTSTSTRATWAAHGWRRLVLALGLFALPLALVALEPPPAKPPPRPPPAAPAPTPAPAIPAPPIPAPDAWTFLLDAGTVDRSIAAGTAFLLRLQRSEGNFCYEYDYATRVEAMDDDAVRQAAGLWALATLHRARPDLGVEPGLRRGLRYFRDRSVLTPDRCRYPAYPGTKVGITGVPALIALTLLDYLAAAPKLTSGERDELRADLTGYVRFLLSLRRPDGLFPSAYSLQDGTGSGDPSPFYDGESLLALLKYAKAFDQPDLRAPLLQSADLMYARHALAARQRSPTDEEMRSFYQWGSMAFYEISTTDWVERERFAARTLEMADWIIRDWKILAFPGNAGPAYEGLAVAYATAVLYQRPEEINRLAYVLDRGLYKHTTFQIGGPLPTPEIPAAALKDERARGGIVRESTHTRLRVDVTQHQMHALILARRFLYK